MTETRFKVQARAQLKLKQLRKQGVLPANVYGQGGSQALQVALKDFERLYQEVGETGLIYLQIDEQKKALPVLIDEIQVDPVKNSFLHVAFKQVDLKDKIKADVPVELVGEFAVPEAVLVTVRDSVEVEALPTDLPEKFEINVEELTEVGQSVTLAGLKYDQSKVDLVVGEEGLEAPVVLVQEQREEEPEPEPVVEVEEAGVEEAAEAEEPVAEEKSESQAKEEVGDKKEKPAEDKKEAEEKSNK